MKYMIEELINNKCIQIGSFQLKNGSFSKYYFDMKNLISYPELLKKIGDELYSKLDDFDIICAIPYGGMPIATYISTKYNKPMIFLRDKQKNYGLKKTIEGQFKETDRCVIIDDVMTSGGSIENAINLLDDKVKITDVGVIFDRQQMNNVKLEVKSVFNKTDVVKYRLEKIKKEKNSDLCFAADLSDYNRLWGIIETIGHLIVICKIHYDAVDEMYRDTFKIKLNELSIKHDFLIMEDRKFNDISYIVKKQYKPYQNWIDMVTVHSLVNDDVIKYLSGVLIVANMSNNDYEFNEKAKKLALFNREKVIGFISQYRLHKDFICMTPGVSLTNNNIDDQNYRTTSHVDTDIKIIGRSIYNSKNVLNDTVILIGSVYIA